MTKVNWLPLNKLIILHIAKPCHQLIYTKTPQYPYKCLIPISKANTRTNIGNKLGPKPKETGKSQYTKDTFCSRIYEIYNDLPSILTSIPDKKTFGIHLKRYLFNPKCLPSSSDPKFQIIGILQGI